MKELHFAQNFSVIALNSEETNRFTNSKKVSLRCMAAAVILELYLNDHFTKQHDLLAFEKQDDGKTLSLYQDAVLQALLGRKSDLRDTLAGYLESVTKLSRKSLEEIESAFSNSLKELNVLEEIPSLISCDLEFETAGISVRAYRNNADLYAKLVESLRAEILEEGAMTDEAILMLWLLKESGRLYDLFSKDELNRVAERFNKLQESNTLAKQVFPINIHKTTESLVKNFLNLKKNTIATPEGSGVNFIFPFIERSQAVFIDTKAYFANEQERLREVEARLESHGIAFTVIHEGAVPLIKIENVLYEAVPYAKQFRVPVHGVQLRRYPLSI